STRAKTAVETKDSTTNLEPVPLGFIWRRESDRSFEARGPRGCSPQTEREEVNKYMPTIDTPYNDPQVMAATDRIFEAIDSYPLEIAVPALGVVALWTAQDHDDPA